MEQYIQWALGVLFVLILGAYKYASSIMQKLDELSKYVYQLPCATTDVEGELVKLAERLDRLENTEVKDAIGLTYDGNTDQSTDY